MKEMPLIAIIVAHDKNRAIGWKGKMPWHLSSDLKRFKKITLGHTVIMGRKTFESLPGGALPGRRNIVISSNPLFMPEGAEKTASPKDALHLCAGEQTVFIIGGATLYRAYIQTADMLYLTVVDGHFEADTWFPEYEISDYDIESETSVVDDPAFPFSYRFLNLRRRKNQKLNDPLQGNRVIP